MKIINYESIPSTHFDNNEAKGVAGRVVVGKADGANNFCMRIFEIAPGGNTPMHSHPWEHEMFIHAGAGEIFGNGKWNSIKPGTIIYMPPNEKHQVRNIRKEVLILACLVPSIAPEL
jgi:quercetin dioxygenase-like cupin family protein